MPARKSTTRKKRNGVPTSESMPPPPDVPTPVADALGGGCHPKKQARKAAQPSTESTLLPQAGLADAQAPAMVVVAASTASPATVVNASNRRTLRKRALSATVPVTAPASTPVSKKTKRSEGKQAVHPGAEAGDSGAAVGMSSTSSATPPSMIAQLTVGNEPPRTRRKHQLPRVNYEQALAQTGANEDGVGASQDTAQVAGRREDTPFPGAEGKRPMKAPATAPRGKPTLISGNTEESQDDAEATESEEDDGEDALVEDPEGSEQSESDDGLAGKTAAIVEAQLAAERPTWTAPSTRSKGKGKATVVEPEPEVDERESGASTDGSMYEENSGSSESTDEEEDSEQGSDNDGEDEVAEPEGLIGQAGPSRQRKAASGAKNKNARGPTKRDLQHARERPQWSVTQVAGPASTSLALPQAAALLNVMMNDDIAADEVNDDMHHQVNLLQPMLPVLPPPPMVPAVPAIPVAPAAPPPAALPAPQEPAIYTIVPPANPGGVLPLIPQHSYIQETLRQAFLRIEGDLIFVHAFPDAFGRSQFVVNAMSDAAEELHFDTLKQQLRTDIPFARALTSIPNQRISTFRGALKRHSDAHVTVHYGIVPGQCEDKIKWLFSHLTYIYPADFSKGAIPWNKPYQHPIVMALLRVAFFTGNNSIASKHNARFSSALLNRQDEKEIPMAMLSLVGAAIHASLTEWKTGIHRLIPFSGDSFLDVYNEHHTLLTAIKNQNLRAYHTMMHNLYKVASGLLPATTVGGDGAENALAHVDINGMDVGQ